MPPCNQCDDPTLCTSRCHAYAEELKQCAASGQMTEQQVAAHVEAGEMPSADQVIELAQALEQKRGLQIVADVAALGSCLNEGAFRAGWESACEEAITRLRTEEWELCLKPIDAREGEAGEMEAGKEDRK